MKKVGLVLLIVMLINCFFGPAVSAVMYETFEFNTYYGADDNAKVTSVAAWGEYLFASTADGMKIYNINTNELEATWNLKSNKVIPMVGNQFVPSQAVVTDDYIIVLSTMNYVAVFYNDGEYTDMPPTLVRRIGSFNSQPRMVYENGYLYILDQAGLTTVNGDGSTTYKAPAGSIVLWKVDINNIESFPYVGAKSNKYSMLNNADMISNGYSKLLNLGERDSYWGETASDGGHLYAVTYNNKETVPYKTLYLHDINLDMMEESSLVLAEDIPTGLSVSFYTETGDINDIKALEIYEVGNESNRELISKFGRNAYITSIKCSDGSFYTTVYFKNAEVFKTYLGAKETELSSGEKKFAIDYNGETYELIYSENTESLLTGAVAAKDGFVYVMTGSGVRGSSALTAENNYGWVVNANDENNMEVKNEFYVSFMPDSEDGRASAVQSALIVGDYLIYFIKSVPRFAAVIDISDTENFSGAVMTSIGIPKSIATSSVLSQAINYGGAIYYPSDSCVVSIGHTVYANRFYAADNATRFPVSISGESSEGKETGGVYVATDGKEHYVNAESGAYLKRILTLPNGEYTVSAVGNEKQIAVDVPDAITITNIENGADLKFDAVNNTNKYLKKAENIKYVAAAYSENGALKAYTEKEIECEYGKTVTVSMDALEVPENGYIVIYPLSEGALLDAPTSTKNGKADRGVRFGEDKELTATAAVNEADKTVTVSGNYIAGADLYIENKRESETADIAYVRCNENGDFSYTYFYGDDVIAETETYTVTIADIRETVTVDADLANDGSFETAMNTLKSEVSTAAELVSYLNSNKDVAAALGIDLSNKDYAELDSGNKAKVMESVLEKIKSGNYDGTSAVFAEKLAEVVEDKTKADALAEVKDAKNASLKGILEKYKEVYGISDSLWKKYTELSDKEITKANEYFIKRTTGISKLSDVPNLLDKAIESIKNEDKPSTGGGNSGSGPSGRYEATKTESGIIPAVTPTANMFKDVADGHWAKSCIEELAKEGIINGIGDGLYAPEEYVTREQMVKILIEAFGMNKDGASASFADVDKNAWYYSYIASAAAIGLAEGDGVNFGTGSYVTRQDAAVMLYRMAGLLNAKVSGDKTTFSDDAEIADYAREAVYKMQGAGVINGTGANKFSPAQPCTRAMAAKIVYEFKILCGR